MELLITPISCSLQKTLITTMRELRYSQIYSHQRKPVCWRTIRTHSTQKHGYPITWHTQATLCLPSMTHAVRLSVASNSDTKVQVITSRSIVQRIGTVETAPANPSQVGSISTNSKPIIPPCFRKWSFLSKPENHLNKGRSRICLYS